MLNIEHVFIFSALYYSEQKRTGNQPKALNWMASKPFGVKLDPAP